MMGFFLFVFDNTTTCQTQSRASPFRLLFLKYKLIQPHAPEQFF